MAWCPTDNKPLPEPMLIKMHDALWYHSAIMIWRIPFDFCEIACRKPNQFSSQYQSCLSQWTWGKGLIPFLSQDGRLAWPVNFFVMRFCLWYYSWIYIYIYIYRRVCAKRCNSNASVMSNISFAPALWNGVMALGLVLWYVCLCWLESCVDWDLR